MSNNEYLDFVNDPQPEYEEMPCGSLRKCDEPCWDVEECPSLSDECICREQYIVEYVDSFYFDDIDPCDCYDKY